MKEKQILESDGQLTARIINAACSLIKKHFPEYGGLESTLIQQSSTGWPHATTQSKIMHLPDGIHWAVISTLGCDIVDSWFKDISVQAVQTIVSLLKPYKSIFAQIMNVLIQKSTTHYGLYCLAYGISLACNEDQCLCV